MAVMAGSFCTVCRARIPKGSRCGRHRNVSPSSRAWHERGAARTRLRVIERDEYRCTRCGTTENLEVHHVDAAEDGGPTTPENLVTVCHDCHLEIEAEKRAG